jgi:hypothetical protein
MLMALRPQVERVPGILQRFLRKMMHYHGGWHVLGMHGSVLAVEVVEVRVRSCMPKSKLAYGLVRLFMTRVD